MVEKYRLKAKLPIKVTPHVLRHCLHPDTQIYTGSKVINAALLYQTKEENICSVDFEKMEIRKDLVTGSETHGTTKLMEIWAGGYLLKCTPEHRLFTLSMYGIEEIKAGELKKGDWVLGTRIWKIAGKKKYKPEFWRFYGYLLGDGTVSLRRRCLLINDKDINNLKYYGRLCQELWQIKPKIEKSKCSNSYVLTIYSSSLAKTMWEFGWAKRAILKIVPPILFGASLDERCAFLAGLYDAEGNTG